MILIMASMLQISGPPKPDNRQLEPAAKTSGDRLNAEKYRLLPRHLSSVCQCRTIHVESTTIEDVLLAESVPLFTVTGSLDKARLSMSTANLRELHGKVPFVAVSHVRSDGLGSWTANALPSCLLRQLQTSVDAASQMAGTPFWIDTLCVPLGKINGYAIASIRRVFAQASIVLVVSQSISKSSATSASDCLEAIAKSSWVKRVWTLQEGAVARSLKFQFETGPVDYDILGNDRPSAEDAAWLSMLALMSDDLSSYHLRQWKQHGMWTPFHSFSVAKIELHRLLRVGYLCTPRFIGFATEEERRIASERLKVSLVQLYYGPEKKVDLFDRLSSLTLLTASVSKYARVLNQEAVEVNSASTGSVK